MSNSTVFPDPDPESAAWLGILYAIYAAIGVPANLLVLILTIVTENVRVVPLNICIFSLAFADTMVIISFVSSLLWMLTYNETICKVGGVGIYMFQIMSLILPSCLAICRHAAICSASELHPRLRMLKKRNGIFILNAIFWAYGLSFLLPFIVADKFGLDLMGVGGISEIDTAFLWTYYMIFVVGMLFAAYAVTFFFYRKLALWVQETSSLMTMTAHTRETLMTTRSLMRMMKWLLFIPVVLYYPGLSVQALLRIFPGAVSIRTARIFVATVPLPHVFDPFVTIFFVKRYRMGVVNFFRGSNTAVGPVLSAMRSAEEN